MVALLIKLGACSMSGSKQKGQGPVPLDREFWSRLADKLPSAVQEAPLISERDATDRLVTARWPSGVLCVRCSAAGPYSLSDRLTFQCRDCRHHFTVKTGTFMHWSRLDAAVWLRAARLIILHHWVRTRERHITVQTLAGRLVISYSAAHRIRELILADLGPDGDGLLLRALCARSPENAS